MFIKIFGNLLIQLLKKRNKNWMYINNNDMFTSLLQICSLNFLDTNSYQRARFPSPYLKPVYYCFSWLSNEFILIVIEKIYMLTQCCFLIVVYEFTTSFKWWNAMTLFKAQDFLALVKMAENPV